MKMNIAHGAFLASLLALGSVTCAFAADDREHARQTRPIRPVNETSMVIHCRQVKKSSAFQLLCNGSAGLIVSTSGPDLPIEPGDVRIRAISCEPRPDGNAICKISYARR